MWLRIACLGTATVICGFGAFLKRITVWIQLALAGKKRSRQTYNKADIQQSGMTESFPKAGGYFSLLSVGLEMLSGGKNNVSPTGLKILLACPRVLRLPFAQSLWSGSRGSISQSLQAEGAMAQPCSRLGGADPLLMTHRRCPPCVCLH